MCGSPWICIESDTTELLNNSSWFIVCLFQVYSEVIPVYMYLFLFKFFSLLGCCIILSGITCVIQEIPVCYLCVSYSSSLSLLLFLLWLSLSLSVSSSRASFLLSLSSFFSSFLPPLPYPPLSVVFRNLVSGYLKLQKIVKDREAWCAAVCRVTELGMA